MEDSENQTTLNSEGQKQDIPAEPVVDKAEVPAGEAQADAPASLPLGPAKVMSWCVLRVASNKEEMVRETLVRKIAVEGLQDTVGRILVPMERRPAPRVKIGGKKFVDRKMYPGYVFIEMELEEDGSIAEHAWFTIKETSGVGDFIGSGGKPAPMSKVDVDKMLLQLEMAQEGAPVALEFDKGDMVKIKEGAFENFEGAVDEVLPDKGLVRVVVTIFGRATPVELEFWQIEKV